VTRDAAAAIAGVVLTAGYDVDNAGVIGFAMHVGPRLFFICLIGGCPPCFFVRADSKGLTGATVRKSGF